MLIGEGKMLIRKCWLVNIIPRAVKSCQKTHPCNRCRQRRL